jgi:hypothetical protein
MYIVCLAEKLFPTFEAFPKNEMCGEEPLTYNDRYTLYVATVLAVGTSPKDRPFTPLNRLCATGVWNRNTIVMLLHVKCQVCLNVL